MLEVPLLQHAGVSARACVEPGQTVLAGQLIGLADSGRNANVHAPASGTIVALTERELAHPAGLMAIHVRLAVAPVQHRATPMAVIDWQHADAHTIVKRAAARGTVGHGAAGVPSAGQR